MWSWSEGEEDVYRSLLDNGAMEQVKEMTLLGVWIYEKSCFQRGDRSGKKGGGVYEIFKV